MNYLQTTFGINNANTCTCKLILRFLFLRKCIKKCFVGGTKAY